MKALFLFLALSAAHAATPAPLLEGLRTAGFVAVPMQKTFRLNDDGSLVLVEKSLIDNKVTTLRLGALTKDGLAAVLPYIGSIDRNALLADPDPSSPQCSDAPSDEIAVFLKGERKVISRHASCHVWTLPYGEGRELSDLATIFLAR